MKKRDISGCILMLRFVIQSILRLNEKQKTENKRYLLYKMMLEFKIDQT